MQIRNLTDDNLGASGITIPARSTAQVPDGLGELLILANPAKFEVAREVVTPEADAPVAEAPAVANRMIDTRAHRCYYRLDGSCRCGATKS